MITCKLMINNQETSPFPGIIKTVVISSKHCENIVEAHSILHCLNAASE
jgi:hypothetical protein